MSDETHLKIYGVLGYPAKHSLSPLMHNAAFKSLGIKAEYKIFEVAPEKLDDFFDALSQKNISGLNVTVPYKEMVLKYLDQQSPEVRFTGACNTIEAKKKNYLKGWNTDGIGFYRHLSKDLKFNITGKSVVILGAGGAAKAVINQLAKKKAKSIAIYDIDKNKSRKLSAKVNREFPSCNAVSVNALDELAIKDADLLINATPVGMQKDDPCLVNPDVLHARLLVYDLIYNPSETKLLRLARSKGAMTANGLGMLFYQGARSFKIWTEKNAPLEVMRQALAKGAKKL